MTLKRSQIGEHKSIQFGKRAKSETSNVSPNSTPTTATTATQSPRARFQKRAEIRRMLLPKRYGKCTDTSIFGRMEKNPKLSSGTPLAPPVSNWPTNFSNASTLNLPSLAAPVNYSQPYMQPYTQFNAPQQLRYPPYFGLYNPFYFNLYSPQLVMCNYPYYQIPHQTSYI